MRRLWIAFKALAWRASLGFPNRRKLLIHAAERYAADAAVARDEARRLKEYLTTNTPPDLNDAGALALLSRFPDSGADQLVGLCDAYASRYEHERATAATLAEALRRDALPPDAFSLGLYRRLLAAAGIQ